MNKNRVDFKQPQNHRINITPYWLLGFVEAEGSFSVSLKTTRLVFDIGQTVSEVDVLKAIQKFIIGLPGDYKIIKSDTNIVSFSIDNKAKDKNYKPMARIAIYKTDFITNVRALFWPFNLIKQKRIRL